MQPFPALDEEDQHGGAEGEEHHRKPCGEADEGHEAGAAVITIAGDNMRGDGNQQFEDAPAEEQLALPGDEVRGGCFAADTEKDAGPEHPSEQPKAQRYPTVRIPLGVMVGIDEFEEGKRSPNGQKGREHSAGEQGSPDGSPRDGAETVETDGNGKQTGLADSHHQEPCPEGPPTVNFACFQRFRLRRERQEAEGDDEDGEHQNIETGHQERPIFHPPLTITKAVLFKTKAADSGAGLGGTTIIALTLAINGGHVCFSSAPGYGRLEGERTKLMAVERPFIICTRGSALALAQANQIAAACRAAFPGRAFELRIIKTTGDKLQKTSLAQKGETLPKGLFTKELEVALLAGEADLAVHSLKDLPTDLPDGRVLSATPPREDVRDVLVYRAAPGIAGRRGFSPNLAVKELPPGATIATSSTRRKMSLLAVRGDLQVVEIRGNVSTRLHKVAERGELDATILALAGLKRLKFHIGPDGTLTGEDVPPGLLAAVLSLEEMLPCVGQGAIGIETRANDPAVAEVVARLNHAETFAAVTAERAFLRGMGGGCQSPVGAHGVVAGAEVALRVISFRDATVRRASSKQPLAQAEELGRQMAQAVL